VFHKVMKSGCRAEEAGLETAERLAKFLALIAVVSWRIFFLTMSARSKARGGAGDSPHPSRSREAQPHRRSTPQAAHSAQDLVTYLLQFAMRDHLARNHDPPPGNVVVWRGLTRLNDIAFGIAIETRRRCG